MEEILNFFGQYQSTLITIIVSVVTVLSGLKYAPDKYLKIFFKSGEVAEKYAEVVNKVEDKTDL